MGIFSSIAAIGAANEKEEIADKTKKEGDDLEKKAFGDRKDYSVLDQITKLQAKDEAEYGSQDRQELALRAQADTNSSNAVSTINRNATSGAEAIMAATQVNQQNQAAIQQATTVGQNNKNIKRQNLAQSTQMLNASSDQAYDLNVQQIFDLNYNKGQKLQTEGRQGKLAAIDAKAAAWGGLGDSVVDMAMTVASGGAYGAVKGAAGMVGGK